MEDQRIAVDEQQPRDGGEKINVRATTLADLFDDMGRATFRRTFAGRNLTGTSGAANNDLNRQSGSQEG
jgi:hypothetical protein